MDTNSLVTDTERELRALSVALTTPYERECLLCYVFRMLPLGCLGLRWATRYRDLRAPRATALAQRLGRKGGFCDCEIFCNAYVLAPELWHWPDDSDRDAPTGVSRPRHPDPMPRCQGVRRGSTQPCWLWEPRERGW